MSSDLHATVRDQLSRTRQRYTRGRVALVDLLVELSRPVTIPELIEAGAGQSQSSLYRNLAVLEQCGVVHRLVSVDDVARYELDEHLTGHHHHLICTDCGRIDDVTLPDALEAALDKAVDKASGQSGYALTGHRLELVGACGDCR